MDSLKKIITMKKEKFKMSKNNEKICSSNTRPEESKTYLTVDDIKEMTKSLPKNQPNQSGWDLNEVTVDDIKEMMKSLPKNQPNPSGWNLNEVTIDDIKELFKNRK